MKVIEVMILFGQPADILDNEMSEKMTDFLDREIECLDSVRSLR